MRDGIKIFICCYSGYYLINLSPISLALIFLHDTTTYMSTCPLMTRLGPVPVRVAVPPMLAAYATHRVRPFSIWANLLAASSRSSALGFTVLNNKLQIPSKFIILWNERELSWRILLLLLNQCCVSTQHTIHQYLGTWLLMLIWIAFAIHVGRKRCLTALKSIISKWPSYICSLPTHCGHWLRPWLHREAAPWHPWAVLGCSGCAPLLLSPHTSCP